MLSAIGKWIVSKLWPLIKKYWKETLILLLAIALFLSLRACDNQKDDSRFKDTVIESQAGTIVTTKDKLGIETAKVKTIVAEREKDILKLETKDKKIIQLQELLKREKGRTQGASIVTTETETTTSAPTEMVASSDTLPADVVTYTASFEDDHIKWKVVATGDSIVNKVRVTNEYEVLTVNKNPWFKRSYTETSWKNLNPYTSTTEFISVDIQPEPKRIGLGIHVGYGASSDGIGPVISGGINYNIVEIK